MRLEYTLASLLAYARPLPPKVRRARSCHCSQTMTRQPLRLPLPLQRAQVVHPQPHATPHARVD
eukprot:6046308-Prymnesium_polylepis.1